MLFQVTCKSVLYSNAASATDFLKIDGGSVLDLHGNKVFSNQQYGFSGILILTARVRTQHPNGIFNNTNNAAFDATGALDYYLLPASTVEYYGVDNQIISGWGLGMPPRLNISMGILKEISRELQTLNLFTQQIYLTLPAYGSGISLSLLMVS